MAREWDLTSVNALQSAAVWMLKKAGALMVVVIRVDDLAVSADPMLAPRDSQALLEDRMPQIHETLQREREEARALAERKREREIKRATVGAR